VGAAAAARIGFAGRGAAGARIEAGLDDDPGDIAQAINNYREVYEFLIADRRAP